MNGNGEAVASHFDENDGSDPPLGEHFGEDIGRFVAKHANGKLKGSRGGNTVVDLGSHGVHGTEDVRFRDSDQKGFVRAYIRTKEFTSEHKTGTTAISVSLLAIGAVITGVATLKHHKRP
jgi:hypothetical protein